MTQAATSYIGRLSGTYDRPFTPESVFELQDDVSPRIVSTITDMNGILPHSMGEALRGRAPDQLAPYEALLRSFSFVELCLGRWLPCV